MNENKIHILVEVYSSNENFSGCSSAIIVYTKETIKYLCNLMDKVKELKESDAYIVKLSSSSANEVLFVSDDEAEDDKALEDLQEKKAELRGNDYIEIDEDAVFSYIDFGGPTFVDVYEDKIKYRNNGKYDHHEYSTVSIERKTIVKLYNKLDPNSVKFIKELAKDKTK